MFYLKYKAVKIVFMIFFLMTVISPALFSQQDQRIPRVPPVLVVRVTPEKLVPLTLSRVDIDVKIFGYIAETEMTMTFGNPNNRVMAGDLYFPLPEGATVSGYALDINGIMVDGVVVERQKARQVFEKELRKGIDPGIVQWVKGNNFKTRVFPIPARGSRTITVKYVMDLIDGDNNMVYHLPLNFKKKVKQFSLRMEVVKSYLKPKVEKGSLANFRFKKWRESYVASTKLKNTRLTKDMLIAVPDIKKRKALVEKNEDGNYFFMIHDNQEVPEISQRVRPKKITVLWDASGSRERSAHKQELKLLKSFFNRFRNQKIMVNLILFRNTAGKSRRFIINQGDSSDLISALNKVQYDGGTQMASISPGNIQDQPDFYMLFTDGISNFGKEDPSGFKRPVYIFSEDASTHHSFLRFLALKTGGEYFNLKRVRVSKALANIGKSAYAFLSTTTNKSKANAVYPSITQPVYGRFTVVGKLHSKKTSIKLHYGVKGKVMKSVNYMISKSDAVKGNLLRRYWAQKKLDELQIFMKRNEQEIVAIGKKYGLVTPGTSLIVLENLGQYIEHKITPPKSLPKMRQKYYNILAQQRKELKRKTEEKIQYVLALWKKRVDWWKKDFQYPKDFRYKSDKPTKSASADRTSAPAREDVLVDEGEEEGEGEESNDDAGPESPVAATNGKKSKDKGTGQDSEPQPSIVIKPQDPNTPYLNKLKQTSSPDKYFNVYMTQKKEYGSSPAFFLDCADFFLRKKMHALALQVLSNIAEMDLENAALLRVLAHRLSQVNLFDADFGLSILIFEEVLKIRPEEPQSYRDLALVLSRRGDFLRMLNKKLSGRDSLIESRKSYKRAIELLYHVVMNKWDRFAEIEVIALMELNNLIPRAKAARIQGIPVDPRLIKLLDLDVRIIMTWDADLTDMDLWITEPSGEKAYYGHSRTTIGGLVSRDFTRGYGPEEYILKKAMRGVYKVEGNFYGSSAPKLIGAVTLQLDVFTNYGRANEKHQSITLRLKNKREVVHVGDIKF